MDERETKMPEIKYLERIAVNVNKKAILRRIGFLGKANIPKNIEEIVDKAIEESTSLTEPKALYTETKIEIEENKIMLNDYGKFFESKFLADKFCSANSLAIFLVTIGPKIEEEIAKAFKEKHLLKPLIFDAIGSYAAESTASKLQMMLKKEKKHSLMRYSPGYNDWDLTEQKIIFSILPAEKIGVKLNEACYMIPQKSVSGVIGLGK